MKTVLRSRARASVGVLALVLGGVGLLVPGQPTALAVNADHGDGVVSEKPAAATPHVMNGRVNAITQIGNRIVVTGTFTSVSPAATFSDTRDDIVRNRIFAFDAVTGQIDPVFNPNLGGAANSLDTDGTHVYVGGTFTSVGGVSSIKRVVKLTATGAVASGFNAVPNKLVNEVVVRGSRLFVGGAFTSITSRGVRSSRAALAALDPTTGTVLDALDLTVSGVYDPSQSDPGSTNVKRFDVTADGTRLVAVGNFSAVGGQARGQLVLLNTGGATTTVAPSTNRFDADHNNCAEIFDTFMRDVDFSPDGSYYVVTTTGAFAGGAGSGTMCDTVTRWETDSLGNDPTWANYTGGDTTYGVAVTASAVYVGGHMRWQNNPFQGDQAGPGAVPRSGIAALDPINGLPLSWNPGRARGVGAQAMFATPQGLWVGSDTTLFAGQRRGRVAFAPLSGGSTVPSVPPATLPNTLWGARRSMPLAPGVLQRRPVDVNGAPNGAASTADSSVDWGTLRGGFMVNETLYYGASDGDFYRRTFNPTTGAVGPPSEVDLYDDPESGQRMPFPIANVTGMFFDPDTHRLYYTIGNDARLYYRYFTPESEVVGAQTFQANAGGVNFSFVSGMTLASDRILYGSTDGLLRSVPFAGGQVAGSPSVLSTDGTWNYRALFIPNG